MMLINEKTKVSAVIKENKDSINAIASLAKPLEKLKNPLLRKVMASRVTLSEAAKMGGCDFSEVVKVLAPLGFEYEKNGSPDTTTKAAVPEWLLSLPKEKIHRLDVREILASGADPLKEIMDKFKTVPLGEALCVLVGFEPVPLINKLGRKNVLTYTKMKDPSLFESYFYKSTEAKAEENGKQEEKLNAKAGQITKDSEEDFEKIQSHFSTDWTKTINVKDLEMPGPRMMILEELDKLPGGHALYVYHKRVPIYLLEDLADMEFEVHIWEIENERDVRLLLFKSN